MKNNNELNKRQKTVKREENMKKYTIYSNFGVLDEVSTKKEAETIVKTSRGECWYKLTEPTLNELNKRQKTEMLEVEINDELYEILTEETKTEADLVDYLIDNLGVIPLNGDYTFLNEERSITSNITEAKYIYLKVEKC